MTNNIPVLPAYRYMDDNGTTGFAVWCEHCDRFHTHSPQEGHCVAHCHNHESPYDDTGYDIQLEGFIEDSPHYDRWER